MPFRDTVPAPAYVWEGYGEYHLTQIDSEFGVKLGVSGLQGYGLLPTDPCLPPRPSSRRPTS